MWSRGGLPTAWLGTHGSLPALESLALEGNLLGGTLPEAAPGALPKLQSLGLQWNQLEARPWPLIAHVFSDNLRGKIELAHGHGVKPT